MYIYIYILSGRWAAGQTDTSNRASRTDGRPARQGGAADGHLPAWQPTQSSSSVLGGASII